MSLKFVLLLIYCVSAVLCLVTNILYYRYYKLHPITVGDLCAIIITSSFPIINTCMCFSIFGSWLSDSGIFDKELF